MKRAGRFADTTKVGKELNAYYTSLIYDSKYEYNKAVDDFYETEYYESLFGKSSRVGWLMQNKGMSLLAAVSQTIDEEKQWEKDAFEWLQDPENQKSENYSDIYKEYYGFRPHGTFA